ncbi:MAG: hypothetical protein JWN04_2617, partial [Myxococcaceae bacterium]|nr:hypothetical protein [Myxococcaceae bacterium]
MTIFPNRRIRGRAYFVIASLCLTACADDSRTETGQENAYIGVQADSAAALRDAAVALTIDAASSIDAAVGSDAQARDASVVVDAGATSGPPSTSALPNPWPSSLAAPSPGTTQLLIPQGAQGPALASEVGDIAFEFTAPTNIDEPSTTSAGKVMASTVTVTLPTSALTTELFQVLIRGTVLPTVQLVFVPKQRVGSPAPKPWAFATFGAVTIVSLDEASSGPVAEHALSFHYNTVILTVVDAASNPVTVKYDATKNALSCAGSCCGATVLGPYRSGAVAQSGETAIQAFDESGLERSVSAGGTGATRGTLQAPTFDYSTALDADGVCSVGRLSNTPHITGATFNIGDLDPQGRLAGTSAHKPAEIWRLSCLVEVASVRFDVQGEAAVSERISLQAATLTNTENELNPNGTLKPSATNSYSFVTQTTNATCVNPS